MKISESPQALSSAVRRRFVDRLDRWWVDLPVVADRQQALELVRSFERGALAPGLSRLGLLPFLEPVASGMVRVGRRGAWLGRFVRRAGTTAVLIGAVGRLTDNWRRTAAELRVLGAIVNAEPSSSYDASALSSLSMQLYLDPQQGADASVSAVDLVPALAQQLARRSLRRRRDDTETSRRIDAAFHHGTAAALVSPAGGPSRDVFAS